MKNAVDVSVLIATYDRLASLAITVRSVIAQHNRLGLTYEIIVVDNHATVSAEATVAALAAAAPFPVIYTRDIRRNMSTLRNTGIKAARGTYVAFIDDDEVADPGWIDGLVGCLRRTGADIAIGPRLSLADDPGQPDFVRTARYFNRDLGLPADADIRLLDALGKPQYGLGTGNSLFVAARCLTGAAPFSIAFGNAGGEDQELFCRLFREGRRLVWAADALVTEKVLLHRTAIPYQLLRTRREAQHYVTIHLEHTGYRPLVFAILTAKGLVQTVIGGLMTFLTLEFRSRSRTFYRVMLANGLGKLSWRRPVGYIEESPDI